MQVRLPKSLRKYIRKQKARIRKEVLDLKRQEEEIKILYEEIFKKFRIKKHETERDISARNKNGN